MYNDEELWTYEDRYMYMYDNEDKTVESTSSKEEETCITMKIHVLQWRYMYYDEEHVRRWRWDKDTCTKMKNRWRTCTRRWRINMYMYTRIHVWSYMYVYRMKDMQVLCVSRRSRQTNKDLIRSDRLASPPRDTLPPSPTSHLWPGLIIVLSIVEDEVHILQEVATVLIVSLTQLVLYCREIHWLLYHFWIILNKINIKKIVNYNAYIMQ